MNNLVLTKASQSNEIRMYFEAILRLKQSNNEFPVNLDDVWQLVYSEKSKAVRALKKDFIENDDFKTIAQNGDGGKFASIDYNLSISCFEYFIAKKVRAVFEVYRQVFHKTVERQLAPPQMSTFDLLKLTVQSMEEQRMELEEVKKDVLQLKAKTTTDSDYVTIMGYAVIKKRNVPRSLAAVLGKKAAAICKNHNIPMDSMFDPRFGKVRLYPMSIVERVFSEAI